MAEKSIIVFTTAYKPFVGGSEIALEQITRRLPNIFFNIITPRYKTELKREETSDNVKICRIGIGSKLDKFIFPVAGFLKALNFSPAIIHSYQASYGGVAALLFKFLKPDTTFILTLQEGKGLKDQGLIVNFVRKMIIKKADIVTAISQYLLNYAKEINPKAKALLIPNGVDLEIFKAGRFSKEELKRKFGIKEEEKVIITVSRLVPKNGVGSLIEAMNSIQSPVRLLIIGSGPLENDLRSMAQKFKLEDRVQFLGNINYDNIPKYLVVSDIFARPSFSEGLGNAFLEAMAMGLPVIGTPVGGIPDFLEDSVTGLFCRPGDPSDIVRKISLLLDDEVLRNRLGENARKLVHEKYGWDNIAREFGELYKQMP